MAGTTITNLLEIIQRKIDAADSTSATQDLLYLLSAVRQGDGSSLELYDSTGAFPDLTDSAADTEMIGYKLDSDRLYFNVGVWKGKSLPPVPVPYSFQGSNFGYSSGGAAPARVDTVDKFPFSSDANATDVGNLTRGADRVVGQSSSSNGYTSGGVSPITQDIIDKFPFASDANASDVGDLSAARYGAAGQSSSLSGYTSGGYAAAESSKNVIDKFSFSSDANATDVGDLTVGRYMIMSGQSSSVSGYTSGGTDTIGVWNYTNVIDKFPFSSDANATDVGDLTQSHYQATGQSSEDNGYVSGGRAAQPGSAVMLNVIQKFPFASDGNSTDVGDITIGRYGPAGQSSTLSGYTSGGYSPNRNIIDKFPFASDANATDVGDLTQARRQLAGQQY